jgi:hypothetical protein
VDAATTFTAPAYSRLTPEQISATVGLRRRDVASCYTAHGDDPQKLELALVLEPSGRVSGASVKSARPLLRAQADCIALKARSWRFPEGGGRERETLSLPFVVMPSAD